MPADRSEKEQFCEWPDCPRAVHDDGLCLDHKREADDLGLGGFDGTT